MCGGGEGWGAIPPTTIMTDLLRGINSVTWEPSKQRSFGTHLLTYKGSKAMTTQANEQVIAHIKEAVDNNKTVYASLRFAAAAAAPELDTSKEVRESVREVLDRYTEHFDGDHNLKAVFTDFLTLHYAADAPVSIERKVGGEIQELHTTGEQATQLSKHDMRKAAKAARDDLGAGRASGGGRTPRQNQNGPVIGALASAKSAVENLLKSEAGITALRELLRENGYQLRKVSK